jgi:uracil-DNA glycosylase family 4
MESWSPEWKQRRYEEICGAWLDCRSCELCKTRRNVVVGQGNLNADIMFVGEAPGKDENREGVPFVGKSGQLLRSLCAEAGIEWEQSFITNIVGCQPPKNRDPSGDEKKACLPRVFELIYLVDPILLVVVGKYALNALAGGRAWGIESERGKLFSTPHPSIRVTGERNGAEIPGKVFPRKGEDKKVHTLDYDMVPIFHPAYLQRLEYSEELDEFPENGMTHRTLNDLKAVLKRVEQLKSEYEVIPKFIERMK